MIAALCPRARRRLAVLFVLAWVLRIAVTIEYEARHPLAQHPLIDERSYESRALEISAGDWLGDEVFFQEPLYPYGLALVYAVAGPPRADGGASERQRTAARHAQAFLGALCVAGVFLLAWRSFGLAAATLAGFATATYPPLLLLPSLLLKPNLFLPVLLGLALLLTGGNGSKEQRGFPWRWLACGVLAGAGALLRGNVLVLLPILVAWPLLGAWCARRRGGADHAPARGLRAGLGGSLALLAGAALVLVPVALRNLHVGGVLVLTTSGAGTNVYGGNNALNPHGRATEFPWVRGIPEFEADDWRREAERRRGAPTDLAASSRFWLAETARSLRADPALHLRILWNKLRLTLGAYEVPDNHDLRWDARHLWLLSLPLPAFGLWGWLGLAGALACGLGRPRGPADPGRGRERGGDARGLALLAFLYLATIVLTVTSMRVRLGLVVLLLPFAGAQAVWLLEALPRLGWLERSRAWLAGGAHASEGGSRGSLVALVVAGALAWTPVLSAEERRADLDKRDFNHAVALLEEGQLDASEELAHALDERHPGTPRIATLLAELDYRRAVALRGRGSTAEREALLDRALGRLRAVVRTPGLAPREVFRARAVAGLAQLEAGDGKAAAGHLRAALAFDPSDRRVRFALANALWMEAGSEPDPAASRALATASLRRLEELWRERQEPELAQRLAEVRAALE